MNLENLSDKELEEKEAKLRIKLQCILLQKDIRQANKIIGDAKAELERLTKLSAFNEIVIKCQEFIQELKIIKEKNKSHAN